MLVKLWESRHPKLICALMDSISPAGGEQIKDVLPDTQAGRLAGDEIASYIVQLQQRTLEDAFSVRRLEDILLRLYDNHPGSVLIFQTGDRAVIFGSTDVKAFASLLAARDDLIRWVSQIPPDMIELEKKFKKLEERRIRSGLPAAA